VAKHKALVASSSDAATVSVVSTAHQPRHLTISDITSIAERRGDVATGYADSNITPVSATGTVKLVIGLDDYEIVLTPGTNNLAGLRMRSTISEQGHRNRPDTGTGVDPNYLSLTANSSGSTTLQLLDDPLGANTNLLTSLNQGANADFKLNGVSVSKASNVINDVVSGATFTILDTTAPAGTVTLSLATNRGQLQSAIEHFANDYNSWWTR